MTAENPKSVADVLDAAADLLGKPGAWTQHAYARDAKGQRLPEGYDTNAVCWCGYGAIEHVTGEGLFGNLRKAVTDKLNWSPDWNDAPERTQAEVVAKLREAASLSRQNGEGGK